MPQHMIGWSVLAAAIVMTIPVAAKAGTRDYCPARPGLGTPACTVEPGHTSVETGLVDWAYQDGPVRTDAVTVADTLVRIGLTDSLEAQIGWTPYQHLRTRDAVTGAVTDEGGTGDLSIGTKVNLMHPDGSGLAIAVQPFVTIPIGKGPAGAGDWGAGLVVPISYDLGHGFSAQFTGEIDAAVNASGSGRHLAYGGTVGLGKSLKSDLSITAEFQRVRDLDPAGAATSDYASLSLGWMAAKSLQLDCGYVFGLDGATASGELYAGISRRF